MEAYLVTQCPVFYVVGFFMPVLSPEVCVVGVASAVAVLYPTQGLVQSSSSEIQTEVRLYSLFSPLTQNAEPMHKLIGSFKSISLNL
jgi:hypothetical protein